VNCFALIGVNGFGRTSVKISNQQSSSRFFILKITSAIMAK
jgi:hypothetical protein